MKYPLCVGFLAGRVLMSSHLMASCEVRGLTPTLVHSSHFGRADCRLSSGKVADLYQLYQTSCSLRMKLLVLCLVLFSLAALAPAQQDVVSDCSKQCQPGCQCPCAGVNTKPFTKYTKMENEKPVADAQCIFDPSMGKTCGQCINGGKQCGSPMQEWCQNPQSKVVR